jgi:hypothetical protein
MGAARSNEDRVLQIGRCLEDKFPAPYPVDLRCPSKIPALPGAGPIQCITGDDGESWFEKGTIHIRIAVRPGIRRSAVIDTLLHEWAHALVIEVKNETQALHCDRWARAYGKLYRWFIDADPSGSEISVDY